MDFTQDPQVIKAKIEKYWKYGLAVAAVLLVAPFAGFILNGILGLAGLCLAKVLRRDLQVEMKPGRQS